MKRTYGAILAALILTLNLSCGLVDKVKKTFSRNPEVAAVSEVLKISVPLAYAITCAMNGAKGSLGPQVQEIVPQGLYKIRVNSTYRLPLGTDTNQAILVTGIFSSDSQAVVSVFFTREKSPASYSILSSVGTVPVSRDTNGYRIVYAAQDINQASDTNPIMTLNLTPSQLNAEFLRLAEPPPTDSNVAVDQNGWIVYIDTNGTSSTLDDEYKVTGAGQYVGASTGGASVVQLVMLNAKMGPQCRLNPYNGRAILRDLDVSSGTGMNIPEMGTTVFTFHMSCNGNVDVSLATGTYVGKTGSQMALNL